MKATREGTRLRQIVLAARPEGKPKPSDFRLEEGTAPSPGPQEVLLGVKYLSLDPYMRGLMSAERSYADPVPIGGVMPGEGVAVVLASKHPDFTEGELVAGQTGWRTYAISSGSDLRKLDLREAPATTALGVLGMPGLTAYGGLLVLGKPAAGETVVVAAASGPVGSLVGQLAKIRGARAVGIAGGAEKCAFVKNELGFDAVVDHRAADFPARLTAACPEGIDVYFELVGGAVWQAVLPLLNLRARVPVCGLVSQYNDAGPNAGIDRLPRTMREVLARSLTLRGFLYREFDDEIQQFRREVAGWIAEGRIRYREDIVDGIENAPEAFIGMLEGRNFGKLLVQMDPEVTESCR